jgi:cytochrome c oxidase subunit IV
MSQEKVHIVPFRVHIIVLLALICLTLISVEITRIDLGTLTVTAALFIASIKGALVLTYFMHLKFDNSIYRIMLIGVVLLIGVVIFVTFLDYLYR